MYLSNKEQIFLGKILKILYKIKNSEEQSVFIDTLKYNFRLKNVLSTEKEINKENLFVFSKFVDNISKRSGITDDLLHPVRNDISEQIKLINKDFIVKDAYHKSYFKKSFLKSFLSNKKNVSHNESEKDIVLLKNDVMASAEKELIKCYLASRSNEFLATELHLIVKAIKNIEDPNRKVLIPKTIFQKVGMIQLGLALNMLSKIDINKNFMDLNYKEIKLIKSLSKNASKVSKFFEVCKSSELNWRYLNLEKIERIESLINKTAK